MKKISYILCAALIATGFNTGALADDAVGAADFAAYEDFAYSAGAKLNSCAEALGADETKGFSGGWRSDVALTANPTDSFTVAEDGKVSVNTSRSDAIYRQMTNGVDLSRDFLYYISATFRINSEVTLDNTHTVKVFLTRQGVSRGPEQLQFGFQGGYGSDKHYSPYMRTKDTTANSQKTVIEPEKTYRIVVRIDAHASSDDVVTYSVYDDGGDKIGEIQGTKAMSDVYDVVAYQEYLGGNLPNEFGNLRVEGYCAQTVALIDAARSALDEAKNNVTAESIAAARAAVDMLPDGMVKDELNAETDKLNEIIEKENRLTAEIEAKLAELGAMEITIDNYTDADAALALIRSDIAQLSDEGAREKYTAAADEIEKTVTAKKISVLKVNETFDYAADTKANSVGADVSNGWSGGYFADSALENAPDDSVVFGSGEYAPSGTVFRKMYYPITANGDNVSYVKWQFSLGEGGDAQIVIGNMTFGADTAAYIGTQRGAARIEPGRRYTAVLRLASDGARLSVYDGKPIAAFDVRADVSSDGADVIGFGGRDCKIYSVEKENIPLSYISASESALNAAADNMTEENISALTESAQALEKCIFKDFALACADGFLAENKNTVPVIRSAGVDGVAYASSTVKAKYVVDDSVGNLGEVKITWHCNGNTAVGESYRIPSDASGADVYFVITVSNKWGQTSEPYTAQSVTVIAQPGSGSGSGGSSGRGSGISGGGTAVKTPDPIPFVTDEPQTSPFADIKGHWAQSIIEDLYKKGVVNGVSETEFKPDDTVTRAEFTALVTKALSLAKGDAEVNFADVSADDWFAEVVNTAASLGIVSGSDGVFRPNDPITREETAKICCAVMEHIGYESDGEAKRFADESDISGWAADYVKKTCAAGVMQGDSDGSFRPHGTATRAESAAIAARLSALKK